MIVTEQEAKDKLCPVMSARGATSKGANDSIVWCQASECMGWRWAPNSSPDVLALFHPGAVPKGYCGLGCMPKD